MGRGLAIAVALVLLAHCGSFGADDPATTPTDGGAPSDSAASKNEASDGPTTADGGDPHIDAGHGPFCAEKAGPGLIACADFDHEDVNFKHHVVSYDGVVVPSAMIGREPQALAVEGTSGGTKAGGGRKVAINPLTKGQTLAIDFVLKIVELTNGSFLDPYVKIAYVGGATATQGSVTLGFVAHADEPGRYRLYVSDNETDSSPLLDVGRAYTMRFEVTRSDDTVMSPRLFIDGTKYDLVSPGVPTDNAAGSWQVLVEGFWEQAMDHGSIVLDDIAVTLQ